MAMSIVMLDEVKYLAVVSMELPRIPGEIAHVSS
jgi:hypothetical protein